MDLGVWLFNLGESVDVFRFKDLIGIRWYEFFDGFFINKDIVI